MYHIDFAEETAIPHIMRLVSRCVERLNANGVYQWDEIYPDLATISQDVANRTLRGLFDDEKLAGILVLNENQSPEYAAIPWQLTDPAPLVVHRLCIDPDYQGKSLSKILMKYTEDYARANGYRSVRLDAFTNNPVSVNLYRSLDYVERGTVRFRKGPFYCFEKIIA